MASVPKLAPLEREWPEQGQWTYADWARLPEDGWRYEVLNGELQMAPPPNIMHQFASMSLSARMATYAESQGLGYVAAAPTGVQLPDQPIPVQPDILFVRQGRKGILGPQYVEGAPDLIVEILSPSNWSYDRKEKFQLYQEAGVPEYWIVDPRTRTVEIFSYEEDEYVLLGKWSVGDTVASRVLPGFQVTVASIFVDL